MYARQKEAIRIGDRYEVIDLIAAGGMGAVYRGWDFHIPRYVAIKALRSSIDPSSDPLASERFRREAQSAARINHPNVVTIYDFLEDRGGQFLIMEYVDGANLKRHITDRGTLQVIRALAIAEQVCAALAAAHACGLVHRDIKPQNILLTPDGRVRLTDFGIVRVAGDDTLTRSGIVLGTADYLSPEQAYGEKLGPSSDLYSLGIVIYEMLTGAVPFTGISPITVAMRHATEQVPSPRALNPAVPPSVEAIWRVSVAKEPRKRYRTAMAMARALRKCRQELMRPLPFPAPGEGAAEITALFPPESIPPRFSLRRWITRRLR